MGGSADFCKRAVAYIRPRLSAGDGAIALAEPVEPVLTDLKNGLLVAYLVDEGSHFRYVQRRHLSDAGWTDDMLHHYALGNLAELIDKTGVRLQPYGAAFTLLFDGNLEASLLLIDALWDQALGHLAPNGFIAAIPTRDVLAFSDAGSSPGAHELREVIGRLQNGDHSVSTSLYFRAPGTSIWRPYFS